jgi:hypothetical protein
VKRSRAEAPQLPGFTFERALGSGGFSDVYLYQQERPRRQVAIKVLVTDDELTDAARAAFDAEADAMASLSAHSSIVSIYQADISADGRPYFVMEYYGGPTLAESYKREPLGVVEALRVGIRIAGALATAHARGILHRDIKPGNVLTNEYGALGLTDFGISTRVDTGVSEHTTSSWALGGAGSTSGTESHGMSIPWSPPESFDDEPNPDVRSDLFSLAATIWTLLAGRTPFEKPNEPNYENDLVGRILRGAITPLTRTDVPSSLVAVLRKAMSVERSHRFDDVVQFARALQRVEIELGYAETPIEAPGLNVPRERSTEPDDDADRTRARGITAIAAQQPVVPAAPAPTGDATRARQVPVIAQTPAPAARADPPPRVEDATVRRAPAVVAAPDRLAPQPVPVEVEVEAEPTPHRRRGRLVGILIALATVAATVTVVVIVNAQAASEREPEQAQIGGPDDPLLGEPVPTPELTAAQVSADGSSVTFTWTNPDPQQDDTFAWTRTDGAATDTAPHETAEGTATIDGLQPGTTVCLSIEIVRDGRLSATPLEECAP